MAEKIIMPKAGMAMEEGKVIRWFKKEGSIVKQGEPLLEIETDKVNMEVEAPASGYVIKILSQEGDSVPVTRTIGFIGDKNEAVAYEPVQKEISKTALDINSAIGGISELPPVRHESGRIAATPLAKTLCAKRGIPLASIRPSGKHGEVLARDVESLKEKTATPLAKKIARAEGIPLTSVTGTGKTGRIYKDDVLKAISKVLPEPAGKLPPVPLSGMRKVIAQRMQKSHAEVPPVTMNTKADVTELSELRKKFNEKLNLHITYNDMAVYAVSRVFGEMAEVNISFTDAGIMANEGVHIGIAVALPNGLIVPVLRNADKLPLREVSQKAKELAEKARNGTLLPDDYTGGTFTVSNLGMYGISSFTPIINQPESMILGVCAIEPSLVMDDAGKIGKHLFMGLSLTFDHRCLDGAQAAAFLKRIVYYLENPVEMLV